MSWVEMDGAEWKWVDVDGAGWSWVHGLVSNTHFKNIDQIPKM